MVASANQGHMRGSTAAGVLLLRRREVTASGLMCFNAILRAVAVTMGPEIVVNLTLTTVHVVEECWRRSCKR